MSTNTAMIDHALEWAAHGWRVIPLRGKTPMFRNPHPDGSAERNTCKGECGLDGHGIHDATTDTGKIAAWWNQNPNANIGVRPSATVFVLDVDPRHLGHQTLKALTDVHGDLPDTFGTLSGRGDGGRHYYFRRPTGIALTTTGLPGIDVKTDAGYVVGAPSIHPDSGKPYVRIDGAIANPSAWLIKALQPPKPPTPPRRSRRATSFRAGTSPADRFTAVTSWADILIPHGWVCLDADPDADGAKWLHPAATSKLSANVRHGLLFVYTTSTVLPITDAGKTNGLTRFRAHAWLNHGGDLRAAARELLVNGSIDVIA
jgi:hypothetical protein